MGREMESLNDTPPKTTHSGRYPNSPENLAQSSLIYREFAQSMGVTELEIRGERAKASKPLRPTCPINPEPRRQKSLRSELNA